jgi:hypothetical protein
MVEDVFISYGRSDRRYVERLAAHLQAVGFTVWWDHQVEPGDSFGRGIQDAIGRCALFVPVLTPDAVTSERVEREISYAADRHKRMFPLVLIPCQPPVELVGVEAGYVVGELMPSEWFVDRLRAATGGAPATPSGPLAVAPRESVPVSRTGRPETSAERGQDVAPADLNAAPLVDPPVPVQTKENYWAIWGILLAIINPWIALILSTVGIVVSGRRGRRGLAVVGLIINGAYSIVSIVILVRQ